ncbi:OLC1v1037288C1 [Oldenlandia corymbosa var. corymbosa]|uniref:OLC1v1037288C1 n=1 Tax=Oldenlandia corymbosa var. corymbosa TaxID=529605 RepID=A0AAV1CXD7_OLDCO|nr:OLC1v1037288C1 [Oldenlandia corymbosa var. corymbosa]
MVNRHLSSVPKEFDAIKKNITNLRSFEDGDFATPEDDAYRRELTINSLFYNIQYDSVEDFTGRGIPDLMSGRTVTPLPPKKSFLDDPVSVLRATRFGARLGFELDQDLKMAASDDEVRAAMAAGNVNRERIAREIHLTVSGNQPTKAMAYICEFGYFETVFSLPEKSEPGKISTDMTDFVLLIWISHGKFLYYTNRKSNTNSFPVIKYICRNSLKLKLSDADTVMKLYTAAQGFVSLVHFIASKDERQFIDVDYWKGEMIDASRIRTLVGLLLGQIKDNWRPALVLSMLLTSSLVHSDVTSVELDLSKELYKVVEDWIVRKGLDGIWEVKPVVNGAQIMSILDLKTEGYSLGNGNRRCLSGSLLIPLELNRNVLIG